MSLTFPSLSRIFIVLVLLFSMVNSQNDYCIVFLMWLSFFRWEFFNSFRRYCVVLECYYWNGCYWGYFWYVRLWDGSYWRVFIRDLRLWDDWLLSRFLGWVLLECFWRFYLFFRIFRNFLYVLVDQDWTILVIFFSFTCFDGHRWSLLCG